MVGKCCVVIFSKADYFQIIVIYVFAINCVIVLNKVHVIFENISNNCCLYIVGGSGIPESENRVTNYDVTKLSKVEL